ncbi:hypothetical protein L7F22_047497 [Adiantum nelumboides]|nr:hypothetical protein [Adiantum nelumboides]
MPPRRVIRRNTRNLGIPEVQNNIESFGTPDVVLKEDFGRDKDLKTLLKTVQPEPFTGEDLDNASKLKEWIISMEDYFDLGEFNFVAKGIMGRAKIKGSAKIWWKINCKSRGVLEITQSWEELQLHLRERYSPPNYLTTKMNEFLACVRRGRTIDTYYEDFIKLSRHAPLITEEQKLSRFILGLEEKLADERLVSRDSSSGSGSGSGLAVSGSGSGLRLVSRDNGSGSGSGSGLAVSGSGSGLRLVSRDSSSGLGSGSGSGLAILGFGFGLVVNYWLTSP